MREHWDESPRVLPPQGTRYPKKPWSGPVPRVRAPSRDPAKVEKRDFRFALARDVDTDQSVDEKGDNVSYMDIGPMMDLIKRIGPEMDEVNRVLEEDMDRTNLQMQKAIEANYEKTPVWQGVVQRFPRALTEIANISVLGQKKYNSPNVGDTSFLDVPDAYLLYTDKLMRHLTEEAVEGLHNPRDGGSLHPAQAAWNALARLEWVLRAQEIVENQETLEHAKWVGERTVDILNEGMESGQSEDDAMPGDPPIVLKGHPRNPPTSPLDDPTSPGDEVQAEARRIVETKPVGS